MFEPRLLSVHQTEKLGVIFLLCVTVHLCNFTDLPLSVFFLLLEYPLVHFLVASWMNVSVCHCLVYNYKRFPTLSLSVVFKDFVCVTQQKQSQFKRCAESNLKLG